MLFGPTFTVTFGAVPVTLRSTPENLIGAGAVLLLIGLLLLK